MLPEGEHMKAQNKISYSKDADILMIQLSDKKIDDAYETDNMIVQVDKKGEPVLLEIFQGKKLLKDIDLLIHKSIKTSTVVAHEVRVRKK